MNIVHLKYAIMVADLGSISKASEKLYIAQPNISRAIKELETDLNITIFDRGSKGMVLTPEGGRFITYGKRVLAQIDEMEKMFKETKKKDVFSISVPRSSYISEAFVKFSKSVNRNNVELLYRETNAYRVLNTVINEGYKLGIIRYSKTYETYFKSFFERKDLKYELLNSFKYVLTFSKDSVLAKKEKITFTVKTGTNDKVFGSISAKQIKDKLDEIGIRSDYLCGHADTAVVIDFNAKNGKEVIKAFPEGEDREAINRCFDQVIQECIEKGIFQSIHQEKRIRHKVR